MAMLTRRSGTLAIVILCAVVVAAAGVQRVVRVFLPTGWGLSPAGKGTAIGDMLAGGVGSPDGAWIAFASVGQGAHKAYVVRRTDGTLADTIAIGQGWIGMGWAKDSRTLYVSGGTTSRIVRLGVGADGKFGTLDSIAIPGIERNRGWLAGLAVGGTDAFVAVSAADKLLRVNLTTGQVTGSLAFEPNTTPYQVRLADDGKLYVSLQGAAQVAEVDTARSRSRERSRRDGIPTIS